MVSLGVIRFFKLIYLHIFDKCLSRYDNAARPIVHGAYHAGRAVVNPEGAGFGNAADWNRAKEQFKSVGGKNNKY